MVVYWDGKVGLCNHDWNNQTFLGDLNVETVREVWTGECYGKVQDLHARGCRKEVPSCSKCDLGGFGRLYVGGVLVQSL
jgi:radical SAM protein with 4Fe4S-binding SPASM domain